MGKYTNRMICSIFIIFMVINLISCQSTKNKNVITDYSTGAGKVIYDFIVSKDGKSVADKVIVTDAKNVTEDGGHQFNIYQYKEYTGQDEFIYFVLKQNDNGEWYIYKRVPKA